MNFTLNSANKELTVNDKGVYITERGVVTFIPLRSIEAIVIKEPAGLSAGYILFRTPGSFVGSNSIKSTDVEIAADRQAVMFKKGGTALDTAIAIRDAIAEKLAI